GHVGVGPVVPVEEMTGQVDDCRQHIDGGPPPPVDVNATIPNDNRAFGVFHPGDSAFAAFFGGNPPSPVGAMVRGSFPSPDYRVNGRFPESFLDGSAEPPGVRIEFLLPLPAPGTPPFPTVAIQPASGGHDTTAARFAADCA